MEPATRINQNNISRNIEGELERPLFRDDESAEQYAFAFLRERERIRQERRTEIKDQREAENRERNATIKEKIEKKK